MPISPNIPRGAALAVADLLDNCARIEKGQEVLLLAQIDGLYGGDNMVDETAVAWIQNALQHRGINASVLWIDEKVRPHQWRYLSNTSGEFIFDIMLSWWSRYIGISPYSEKPIRLTVDAGRIVKIEGGQEAKALKDFMASMVAKVGNGVYDFKCLHFGVHPQARISAHQCPNPLYRRLIEHAHSSCIHVHVGAPPATDDYPYWVHCTGDTRTATFKVGDTVIHDRGYLKALENPKVLEVARKYPDRPGVDPVPLHY